MTLRVKVDRTLCIGTADCTKIAPNTFELDREAKAVVKKQNGDTDEKILESAKVCPVLAITIEDPGGKQIYP